MGNTRALVTSKDFSRLRKENGAYPSLTSPRAVLMVSCESGSVIWRWENVQLFKKIFFFWFCFLWVF